MLVDCEVHVLPPEWCGADFRPPAAERTIAGLIYDHPERQQALRGASAEGLLAEMTRAGVDKAVLLGLPWVTPSMCWRNNSYVANLVERHRRQFIGMGVIPPPRAENPAAAVRRVHNEYGLRGVKVIPSWQGYRLDDAVFDPAIEALCDLGLVLVPHTDHLYRAAEHADTAASLYNVARRYPELRILAPHLGGLLCLYGLHEPVRPVLANMLFITSVPLTMPMVLFALQAIGPDQLAFGTDFPFNPSHDQHSVVRQFEALPIEPVQRCAIAGANALRFLSCAGDDCHAAP